MVKSLLNRETLMPCGVVASILVAAIALTWSLASDRERAFSTLKEHDARILRNETAIRDIQCTLGDVRDGVIRIEEKLGTKDK
jgi:hypothetical protein